MKKLLYGEKNTKICLVDPRLVRVNLKKLRKVKYIARSASLPSGLNNGVDLTGLLGGHKRRLGVWGTEVPSWIQGRSPGRGSPEAEAFL